MVDKRSFCNSTLADKGINYVGQLSYTNGALKVWYVFKNKFRLSKNSHFYWIQLNNAIPKSWKENLYKGDKKIHDLTFTRHHIIKMYQIYSLTKCNSKELYSPQASLNDSKTKSQIYFEKLVQNNKKKRSNGNVYTFCHVVWLLTLTYVYFGMKFWRTSYEKLLKFKIVSSPFCSFFNSENKNPIHLFCSCNQIKSFWSRFQELLNSEILPSQNTPQIRTY